MTNFNVTINYEFDFAELISSTTLSNYDAAFYVDLAGSYGQLFPFALDAYGYDDMFVQETRLVSRHEGPVEWVAGFFYHDKRRTVDFGYRSTPEYLAANGLSGILPNEYYYRFNAYTDQSEIAGFGELTFRFSDRFWVTGGLRYGNTKTQSFIRGGGYNSNYLTNAYCRALPAACFGYIPPLTVTDVNYSEGLKVSDDRLSWKASMSWKPVDSLTAYATVSTGFRTPVVNALAGLTSTIDPADLVIPAGARSDSVTNYEVGLKGRWLGGDLTANIAGYYIDWKNIQVQANRISDTVQFATNIGAAESYGLEFEIMARPVTGLSLALNGSYNEAKVTKLTALEAAISGATVGTRLASPHFQGSGTLRYDFGIGDGKGAYAAVNVSHVGSFPNQFPNAPGNPLLRSPTYGFTDAWTNVNLYAGARLGKLDLTAYVENLLDDDSITYVHPEAFIDGRHARMRPRTVGVRANYRF
jgi:outer membrane receptor protein involved in Fe transport